MTVCARQAIVAVPPALAANVRYEPKLPAPRALLLQRLPAGWTYKFVLVYDEPFWRSDGLSGESIGMGSPIELSIDACGATSPPGILNAFAAGPHARALARLAPDARRDVVVGQMAARLGPKAAQVRHYVETEFADEEWTRGCYMAHYPPGVLTQFGYVIREPVGRIHWAGTETSPVMNGFIDGAVRSGERAAAEVLAIDG